MGMDSDEKRCQDDHYELCNDKRELLRILIFLSDCDQNRRIHYRLKKNIYFLKNPWWFQAYALLKFRHRWKTHSGPSGKCMKCWKVRIHLVTQWQLNELFILFTRGGGSPKSVPSTSGRADVEKLWKLLFQVLFWILDPCHNSKSHKDNLSIWQCYRLKRWTFNWLQVW